MDYFLGKRPTGATTDSKVDLGMIVRDIDELMILNEQRRTTFMTPRWPGSSPLKISTTVCCKRRSLELAGGRDRHPEA